MSLINDALKRASQSDRNRPRQPETRAAMQPVVEPRGRSLLIAGWLVVVVVVGLASWFLAQWWYPSQPPAHEMVESHAAVAPKPAPAPAAHEAMPPPVKTPPPQAAAPAPVPAPAPVVAPAPAPPPSAKPVVEAWPVELKLMGIFFSKTNPRALINGKTLSEGDEINGIRVTKIEHDQVTVEWRGQVKELLTE